MAREHDILVEFLAITGADESIAQSLLEATEWNLEAAVTLYLEDSPAAASFDPASVANQRARPPPADDVRAPIPQTTGVLVDEDGPYSFAPRVNVHQAARSAVFEPLRDFRSEHEAAVRGNAANNERQTLSELFRPPLDLMFNGSLEKALRHSSASNKWLLVNIQKTDVFACQVLNRDLWSDPDMRDFIREHLVFWQVYHDSVEGQEYQHVYPFDGYPHIAILHPVTGERVKYWAEPPESNELLATVVSLLAQYSDNDASDNVAVTPTNRKRRAVDDEEMELRAAIAASLADANSAPSVPPTAVDTPRQPSRPSTASGKGRVVTDVVPVEPPAGAPASDVTRVQFRMPDGKRVVRRFFKNDIVAGLYAFVRSSDAALETTPFEIMVHRDKLGDKKDMTLAAAGIQDALLTVTCT